MGEFLVVGISPAFVAEAFALMDHDLDSCDRALDVLHQNEPSAICGVVFHRSVVRRLRQLALRLMVLEEIVHGGEANKCLFYGEIELALRLVVILLGNSTWSLGALDDDEGILEQLLGARFEVQLELGDVVRHRVWIVGKGFR